MAGIKLSRLEEQGIVESQRKGLVLITAGKVLLWMDMLLLIFVYVGIRDGSYMWTWWVLGEALLGVILIAIGSRKRGTLTH